MGGAFVFFNLSGPLAGECICNVCFGLFLSLFPTTLPNSLDAVGLSCVGKLVSSFSSNQGSQVHKSDLSVKGDITIMSVCSMLAEL